MGILANGFRDNLGAYQTYGATVSNNAYPSANWRNTHRTAAMRNITAGEGITDDKVSIPSGNRHPNTWMMPQKAGAMASRNLMVGTGSISANAWAVKLAEASVTGTGELTAIGGLVVQLIASITGSGTITAADLKAFLAAVADLSGSGGITTATRTGYGELLASIVGDGTLDSSTATGTGELGASIVAYGDLTPEGIRDSVWNAILAQYGAAGSAGNALATASSGGVDYDLLAAAVWERAIEGSFTSEQILRIMAAALTGKVSGAGTTTEVFRDMADTKDRLTYTVDSSGNRTAVVRDGT